MAFNHYAKIKRILAAQPAGWYVVKINEPTTSQSFKGEARYFDHYYRVYSAAGQPIKFCKFQQLDRFASVMSLKLHDIPIIEQ